MVEDEPDEVDVPVVGAAMIAAPEPCVILAVSLRLEGAPESFRGENIRSHK
jgi:hypothetical protein